MTGKRASSAWHKWRRNWLERHHEKRAERALGTRQFSRENREEEATASKRLEEPSRKASRLSVEPQQIVQLDHCHVVVQMLSPCRRRRDGLSARKVHVVPEHDPLKVHVVPVDQPSTRRNGVVRPPAIWHISLSTRFPRPVSPTPTHQQATTLQPATLAFFSLHRPPRIFAHLHQSPSFASRRCLRFVAPAAAGQTPHAPRCLVPTAGLLLPRPAFWGPHRSHDSVTAAVSLLQLIHSGLALSIL